MITIELFTTPNCISCTRAQSIILDWYEQYSERISVRYFSLDKKSFTYDIDKGILQQRLGYVPTHAPVIFINGKEVKLSQLSQEIQDNL